MNDDLQPLKNRLRWLNRSILVLGVVILLGVIVWAVQGLRRSEPATTSTVIHPASSVANLATRAASAVASSQPKPALSTAQQERNAAAAMNALATASAPAAAAAAGPATPASAPAASGPTPVQAASVAAATTAVAPVETVAATSEATQKPAKSSAPKPTHHKAAAAKPSAHTAPPNAKAKPVGTVGVCRSAGWYVQVGAFGKTQSIERLARKLHGAGYTRVCVAAKEVRGLRLFYVGPYRDAAAARDARAPLHKLTGSEGILRKLP